MEELRFQPDEIAKSCRHKRSNCQETSVIEPLLEQLNSDIEPGQDV